MHIICIAWLSYIYHTKSCYKKVNSIGFLKLFDFSSMYSYIMHKQIYHILMDERNEWDQKISIKNFSIRENQTHISFLSF